MALAMILGAAFAAFNGVLIAPGDTTTAKMVPKLINEDKNNNE